MQWERTNPVVVIPTVVVAPAVAVMMEPLTKRSRISTTFRIFYDTETSGRGCTHFKQARIVELAAVTEMAAGTALTVCGLTPRKGKLSSLPEGYFSELVAGGPCTAAATAVHCLRDEDLRYARPFEDVWSSFVAFAHAAQKNSPTYTTTTAVSMVGHNSLSTDGYWLLSELARCSRSVNELALPGRQLVFEDTYPKILETQKRLKVNLGISSLKNSAIHSKLWPHLAVNGEVHTALWDAAATRDNWRGSIHVRQSAQRVSSDQQQGRWAVVQAQNRLDALPAVDVSDGEEE